MTPVARRLSARDLARMAYTRAAGRPSGPAAPKRRGQTPSLTRCAHARHQTARASKAQNQRFGAKVAEEDEKHPQKPGPWRVFAARVKRALWSPRSGKAHRSACVRSARQCGRAFRAVCTLFGPARSGGPFDAIAAVQGAPGPRSRQSGHRETLAYSGRVRVVHPPTTRRSGPRGRHLKSRATVRARCKRGRDFKDHFAFEGAFGSAAGEFERCLGVSKAAGVETFYPLRSWQRIRRCGPANSRSKREPPGLGRWRRAPMSGAGVRGGPWQRPGPKKATRAWAFNDVRGGRFPSVWICQKTTSLRKTVEPQPPTWFGRAPGAVRTGQPFIGAIADHQSIRQAGPVFAPARSADLALPQPPHAVSASLAATPHAARPRQGGPREF